MSTDSPKYLRAAQTARLLLMNDTGVPVEPILANEVAEAFLSLLSEIAQTNAAAQAHAQLELHGKIGKTGFAANNPASTAPHDESETVIGESALTWKGAALSLGERLADVGPNGYYAMSAVEWMTWCSARIIDLKRELNAARSATGETWRPMMSAPLDGTEIEILFEHFDYWTCLKLKGKEQADKEYRAVQRAHWIDHNGGGWTWHGMAGSPVGWRPISASDSRSDK